MTSLNYEPLRPLRFVSLATQYFEKYKKLVPGGKLYTVKKKARLTCRSNRRLTFSSILSIAIAVAVAIAARYDTIYYTLYPMYSGVAPNCHALPRSACSMAYTYES